LGKIIKSFKRSDWKKWIFSATDGIDELTYGSKKELDDLFSLQEFYKEKFVDSLKDLDVFHKIEDYINNIHSITIQEIEGQYRLHAICVFYNNDDKKKEKRISLFTVGNRTSDDSERREKIYKIKKTKALFGALRGISQSIIALI